MTCLPIPRCLTPFASIFAGALLLGLTGCTYGRGAEGPASQWVSSGQSIAQRQCGQCHAVMRGQTSPLADAPTFLKLRASYSRLQMAQILERRMTELHPRMPAPDLDEDEMEQFLIYWDGLKPAG